MEQNSPANLTRKPAGQPVRPQDLIALSLASGATHAAILAPYAIPFVPELRQACEQNQCGRYATCWVGPPAIGAVADLIDEVRAYDLALVIQTVGQLEDSFDYEGMVAAKTEHIAVYQKILAAVRTAWPGQPLLALDAGCCDLCPTCTYPDEPCRHPDEAIPSVEAYGIYVNAMLNVCGLKYNNGPNTVSYVGLILLGKTGKNQGCDSMAADRAGQTPPGVVL
jgi:predicted metal-binding protein